MKSNKEQERVKDRRMQSLFITMIFPLLIAMVSNVTNGLARIAMQIVLLFSQFVIMKSLLDDYYKYSFN